VVGVLGARHERDGQSFALSAFGAKMASAVNRIPQVYPEFVSHRMESFRE
jgi:hypothetical protein